MLIAFHHQSTGSRKGAKLQRIPLNHKDHEGHEERAGSVSVTYSAFCVLRVLCGSISPLFASSAPLREKLVARLPPHGIEMRIIRLRPAGERHLLPRIKDDAFAALDV